MPTPALRVADSSNGRRIGAQSIRCSWKRYTARAVAACTSAAGYFCPTLNVGRVSVSKPTTRSPAKSSAARSASAVLVTSTTRPSYRRTGNALISSFDIVPDNVRNY